MYQISFAMEAAPLQDPYSFRSRYIGWRAAAYLMDPSGEVNLNNAKELHHLVQSTPFPIGPNMEQDADIYSHLLHCLTQLLENQQIVLWLKKFSIPLCHRHAVRIIQETLLPDKINQVQTSHIRRAALTAWFTPLRQNTGSCFATAPAILIQREQPEYFLKDLYDLLSTGQFSRTFGGKRYTVPLSPSPGVGDLQKPLDHLAAPGLQMAASEANIPLTVSTTSQTVEIFLREQTLTALHLSEQDLLDEKHLISLQMTPLLAKQNMIHYQKPTERGERIADFERRFALACNTFRAVTECALLRSWEYSLASFTDVKLDFTRWNLYVSLGLHPQNEGGIGSALYHAINSELQICNQEIEQAHRAYEIALSNVRSREAILHRSGGAHRHQIQAELTTFMREANTALEFRDQAVAKGRALADSFPSLIEQYDKALQEQFQEIFDPSIRDPHVNPMTLYNDSPAGFRLMYKHGRTDASLWTLIHSEEDYLQSLRSFFSSLERDLTLPSALSRHFASQITTKVIQHLATDEFLSSAMQRARQEGRSSPWHYFSGGTLPKLVQNYYAREKELTELAFIPHSAEELMQFFQTTTQGKTTPLLCHSPTHAFLLRPDWPISSLHAPKWTLTEPMQEYLAHQLNERLPPLEKPLFLHLFRKHATATTNQLFRLQLIDTLHSLPTKRNAEGIVDSLFYECFPLLTPREAQKAMPLPIEIHSDFISAIEFFSLAKQKFLKEPFSSHDIEAKLIQNMRQHHLAYPAPYLFADTNWAGWSFGWIHNPITYELELWRFNRIATKGFPMHEWKPYFSAQNTLPWIVLSKSEEYKNF